MRGRKRGRVREVKLKGGDERGRLKEKWVLGTKVGIVEEKKEEEEGWCDGDAGFGVDVIVDKLTTQLNLIEDENKPIVVERPIGNNRRAPHFILVGRLLTLKDFRGRLVQQTIMN
ncbi:hypothetical protein L3X38_005033 [Prunus dulcis]|uniref:Uncharacterized protein n=1 Tax=Prunus dulcis TaxID=3755 RepID=A0AAD5F3Q8_PRUDU|nr:hypothetical protein L3X38_005033 [Prunus dulcis]